MDSAPCCVDDSDTIPGAGPESDDGGISLSLCCSCMPGAVCRAGSGGAYGGGLSDDKCCESIPFLVFPIDALLSLGDAVDPVSMGCTWEDKKEGFEAADPGRTLYVFILRKSASCICAY